MQQRRGPWSPLEDANLCSLVQRFGAHNWVRISQLVGTRSPKQCRERFHQNLKPQLNREPITPEEGALIEQLVAEMGKKWAEIARRLNGRSDNAVKNWWNGGMNRRKRMCLRQKQIESTRTAEHDRATYKLVSIEPMPHGHPHHPLRHYVEAPLLSPPLSTSMSRRGSKETTPALTLDSVSPNSASPRIPASPRIDVNLPPLNMGGSASHRYTQPAHSYHQQSYDSYDRRRSLPLPHEESRYNFSTQSDKAYLGNSHSSHDSRLSQLAELSQSFRPLDTKQLSGFPPVTPTSSAFPALPPTPLSPASSSSNKDRRMNLSSILL